MTRSKILRKIGTVMLAAVMMMMSLAVPAFASGTGGGSHKIIINNVVPDATYKVYKLLDLVVTTKDDAASPTGKAVTAYRYTFSDGLKDIVSRVAGRDEFKYDKNAANAMGFDANKNVLIFQVPDGIDSDAALQAKRDSLMLRFADALRAEVESGGAALTPERTINGSAANANRQIVVDGLADGYWMVTSNAGARSIVFTNPSDRNGNMVIQEKNAKPTIEKTADTDIAGVGDRIEYTIRANAGAGSENLIVVDTMSDGLRFDRIGSVTFKPSRGGTDVAMSEGAGGYTFADRDDKGNNGFRLTIDPAFLKGNTFIGDADTMTDDGGTFEIVYSATITGDAVTLDKVTNSAKLRYGHNPSDLLEIGSGDGGVRIPDLDPDKTYTVKWVDENGDPIPEIDDVTIHPGDLFPVNPSREGKEGYWEDPVGPDESGVIIIKWHSGADKGDESNDAVVDIALHQVDLLKHVQGDETAFLENARFMMFRNPVTGTASADGLAVLQTDYDQIVTWSTGETPEGIPAYVNGKSQGLVRFVDMGKDADGNQVYRPAVVYEVDGTTFTDEYSSAVTVIKTPSTGRVVIKGLGPGLYSFKETEAPAGYNKLGAPVYLAVQDGENAGKYVYRQDDAANLVFAQNDNNTIKIGNASGLQLPRTGGIGTTIFYITGAVLILGAGVLLIMKTRKGGNEQ